MADKRQVKRSIKQLQRVKTWQLVLLLILSLLLTATLLRLNNIGMIERRTAVLNADEQGIDEITQARLFDLQRYSAAHMNANSGPIYLEAQYKRDIKKAADALVNANTNKTIQDRKFAYDECAKQFSAYSYPWTLCIGEKLSERAGNTGANVDTGLPNAELYRHEYTSPTWSPDFAGFSIILSGIIALAIVLRLAGLAILRLLLRRHYKSI